MTDPTYSYELRAAAQSDFESIKALIHAVQINPMGLKWQNFLVAIDPQARLIGCGQVKSHGDGSLELASIAIVPEWRKRGIASAIIRQLLEEHPHTLFLTCRAHLEAFYIRFGFRTIESGEMPPYFKKISRLASLITRSGLIHDRLLVMRRVP